MAIVGMSCVMPQSEDPETFWRHLTAGDDLITDMPMDRWDGAEAEENNIWPKKGGFMFDVDKFDPLFFGISPRDAELMDPQQRIFLEVVWHAIEDAGYKPSELSGTQTGVFAGVATNDYAELASSRLSETAAYAAIGMSHSVLPNRISFLLDLRGPSEAIDTACSSSLVAIRHAVTAIRAETCEMAIAGGVNLILNPALTLAFDKAGMLSQDCRCKTFDKQADGYVRGEGAGAILLKSLDQAQADGDHVYAVILGTSENHGGHASSLTAPNPTAQADLLIHAYEDAGIGPETVSYIEAHGTGTSLGDPVEVNALKKAFAALYEKNGISLPDRPHCGLGSVKTNIGHLEAAAGIAGVIKVILSMTYQKLPANIHFQELNPYIRLEGTPFFIVRETQDWTPLKDSAGIPIPRRAGVSSFGFGGSNVHIVLEEASGEACPRHLLSGGQEAEGHVILVLSAKNEERLRAYAEKMAEFLGARGETSPLADIAYTLQVGREAMPARLAAVVSNVGELRGKLDQCARGEADVEDLHIGNVKKERKETAILLSGRSGELFVRTAVEDREFTKLAQLWVAGAEIDWSLLYPEGVPNRVSLPTYPFARERYWIPEAGGHWSGEKPPVTAIHPLIDTLVPDLSVNDGLVFRKLIQETDGIVRDHKVGGEPAFPRAGYLEMAYGAASQIEKLADIDLYQTVFLRPLVIQRDTEVRILIRREAEDLTYEIQSGPVSEPLIHFKGLALLREFASSKIDRPSVPISEIRCRCVRRISKRRLYRHFEDAGIAYGPAFQIIQELFSNETEAISRIELSEAPLMTPYPSTNGREPGFFLHPSLLDGAFQTVMGLMAAGETEPALFLPFDIEKLEIFSPLKKQCHVYVKNAGDWGNDHSDTRRFLIQVTDETGTPLTTIHRFSLRRSVQRQSMPHRFTCLESIWEGSEFDMVMRNAFDIPTMTEADEKKLLRHIEKELSAMLATIVKVREEDIEPEENLIGYGLDSITFTEFSHSLNRKFGLKIGPSLFFDYPSIHLFSRHLISEHRDELLRRYQIAAGLTDDAEVPDATYPPSSGQRALWLIHRLAPESVAYNIGGLTFREFMRQVRGVVSDAMKHQAYPFPLLVQKLAPERDPSCNPLFQVSFIFQSPRQSSGIRVLSAGDEELSGGEWAGMMIEPFDLAEAEGEVDIELYIVETEEFLTGDFVYNTDLFDEATIQRMNRHFHTLLEAIVANPDMRLADLPMMDESEDKQMLARRNAKRQVTIRGFRVELDRIETVLSEHPEVKENVVTPRTTPAGDDHLIAYLVLNPDADVETPSRITNHESQITNHASRSRCFSRITCRTT